LTDSKISHLYCKKCGKTFNQPARFKCGDYLISLLPGKKIYGYHSEVGSRDFSGSPEA
jgi:hypothetical protein